MTTKNRTYILAIAFASLGLSFFGDSVFRFRLTFTTDSAAQRTLFNLCGIDMLSMILYKKRNPQIGLNKADLWRDSIHITPSKMMNGFRFGDFEVSDEQEAAYPP